MQFTALKPGWKSNMKLKWKVSIHRFLHLVQNRVFWIDKFQMFETNVINKEKFLTFICKIAILNRKNPKILP
jgi:hypothetical protein